MTPRQQRWLMLVVTLCAFGLRVWGMDSAPPGYSDDELSNALVLSQEVLDGDWTWYFNDASGHEPLFHTLAAGMLALFGRTWPGIRLLSIILGTLAVPLVYVVGRRLFAAPVGITAAAALAVSFWGLHYSRINLRHVSLPAFMLLTFALYWLAVGRARQNRPALPLFLAGGIVLGVGYYTYFASRGVPLILLGFLGYTLLAERDLLRRIWRGTLLALAVSLLLAVPLALAIRAQEGGDARVSELAVPLIEARDGRYGTLFTHVERTLLMFHADGDEEFLYNIPGRPVFGPLTALFFWSGVALCTALLLVVLAGRGSPRWRQRAPATVFLLGWWFTGLTPAFISVPPASLSHTIIAQPATYLLLALPLLLVVDLPRLRRWALPLGALLVILVAVRDLPAYFDEWPQRGLVRFLYHADMRAVADYAAAENLSAFGVGSLLVEPWDRQALTIELANALPDSRSAAPRWYNPQRAIFLRLADQPPLLFHSQLPGEEADAQLYRDIGGAGAFAVAEVDGDPPPAGTPLACFDNGLCLLEATWREAPALSLTWRAERLLTLPPIPLASKPPAPGVYAGPRLLVFAQLLAPDGTFLAGDDGLWVDPQTLQAGDVFRQTHRLPPQAGAASLSVGLYDPLTGTRIPLTGGGDALRLPLTAGGQP